MVFSFKTLFVATAVLYAMNQLALLPPELSSVVSRALFWPTLPITVARRVGKWTTVIDDTVVMGGAPFGFAHLPERLLRDYGVRERYSLRLAAEPRVKLSWRSIRPLHIDPWGCKYVRGISRAYEEV
jgi:hypothetical protein